MKVVFFEVMPGEREALSALLSPEYTVDFRDEALDENNMDMAADADVISVFVKSQLRAPMIDKLPNLKFVSTRSMGYDHIDVAYARTKGIKSVNVSTYASHPVAEFTFALLLSVSRLIYHANDQLRNGMNFDIRGLKGYNLFGKTIGVVGTGHIGRNVVTIAKGFGMNILAFDVRPDDAFAIRQGFRYAPLEDVVVQSDIISLHIPYLKETHHLFNDAMFDRMKQGVIVINTARGEIIDTHALIGALRSGKVWGAGLDVLEAEHELHEEGAEIAANEHGVDFQLIAANHLLINLPNVIVTPHIAFETVEAMQEISRSTAESINAFLSGAQQKYL